MEIVAHGKAGHFALLDHNEGTDWQLIYLPMRVGKPFVCHKVFAMNNKFRCSALTGSIDHQENVFEVLAVALLHVRKESPKAECPDLPFALIEIVGDIIGEAIEHRTPIAVIEQNYYR